jgi:hypothetical protein
MTNPTNQTTNKRKIIDSRDSDSEEEGRNIAVAAGVEGAWPRFLLVGSKTQDKPVGDLSPFLIQKWFVGVSSVGFKSIKRLRSGDFLVECSTRKASDLLLRRDSSICVDRPITVSVHRQLNSSRGVIRCPDLRGLSDIEIKDELVDQGVSEVRRVLVTKDGKKIPTNTLFVTFAMATLPESIRVGYLKVRVTPFVPSPLRCFKCQKFGHGSKNCNGKETCNECGKDAHEGSECQGPKYCVNCEGKHQSSSKQCPRWKLEQDIQKVKTLERCSFADAKRKVMAALPDTSKTSYASAAASQPETSSATLSAITQLIAAVAKLTDRLASLEAVVLNMRGGQQATPNPVNQKPPTAPRPAPSSSAQKKDVTGTKSAVQNAGPKAGNPGPKAGNAGTTAGKVGDKTGSSAGKNTDGSMTIEGVHVPRQVVTQLTRDMRGKGGHRSRSRNRFEPLSTPEHEEEMDN